MTISCGVSKRDAGTSVAIDAPVDTFVAGGHVWKEALPLLSQRAYAEATQLLFINAVLLGAGH